MGLLDDVFNSPQGQLGIGLLAAAGPSFTPMGIGQRLAQAQQFMQAQRDNEQMGKLRQAQLDDTTQQMELRKQQAAQLQRKSEMLQNWLGQLDNPTQANAAVLSQTGNLAPTNANAAVQTQALRSGGNVLAGSGISPDAIRADLALNEGKNVPEWLFKRTTPDIQVSNGYAYDKNAIQPGYLPQLNVSQDGKSSLIQIGKNGLPVVSAPTGALDTYAGYKNIDESIRANFDPVTVTPQGQNPQMTTRGALVRNPQLMPGPKAAIDDNGRVQILNQELEKSKQLLRNAINAGDQSAVARAQTDIASINRELAGTRPTVGMPLQSEEEKARANKGVETDSAEAVARAKDVKTAQKFLSVVGQAEKSLDNNPTHSGAGALVDKGLAFFGKTTDGAVEAQRLKALGGWLVSNVPRMEGPQSNFDVANYQTMAADVANDTLPIEARKAALEGIKTLMNKTIDSSGMPTPAQTPSSAKFDQLPPASKFTGKTIRDTATGKILKSNGLQWKEQ